MAIALATIDYGVAAGASSSTVAATLPATPAAGTLVVFQANIATAGDAINAVGVQTNVTWNAALRGSTNHKNETQYGIASASAGTGFSAGKAGSSVAANHVCNFASFTGLPAGGGYNASASGILTANSTTTVATPTVTPTPGAEVLLVAMLRGAGTMPSAPAGWTALTGPGGSPTLFCYRIISSASGSYSCSTTWGSSGNVSAAIMCFEVVPTITVEIVSQAECVLQGAQFGVVARRMVGGVVDGSYTGNMVLSKTSGTGTLSSASSLTKACVAGVATWTDLSVSAAGVKVLQALESSTSVTQSLASIIVRETAYTTTGAWLPKQTIRDSYGNVLHDVVVFIPNGISAVSPRKVLWYQPGGSTAYGDPSSNGAMSDPLPAYVTANASTYPFVVVICLSPVNNPATMPHALVTAIPELRTRLTSDGYDLIENDWLGWSTGAIRFWQMIARNPTFIKKAIIIDFNIYGPGITDGGFFLNSSFADPGPDNLATAIINELARIVYQNGMSLFFVHGQFAKNNPAGPAIAPSTAPTRNIYEQDSIKAAIAAQAGGSVASVWQSLTYNTGTTQPAITSTKRFVQIFHNIGTSYNDHFDIYQDTANSTNWPANAQPWLQATHATFGGFRRLINNHVRQFFKRDV